MVANVGSRTRMLVVKLSNNTTENLASPNDRSTLGSFVRLQGFKNSADVFEVN